MGRAGSSRRSESDTARPQRGLDSLGGNAERERDKGKQEWTGRKKVKLKVKTHTHKRAGEGEGSRRLTPRRGKRAPHTHTDATHHAGQELCQRLRRSCPGDRLAAAMGVCDSSVGVCERERLRVSRRNISFSHVNTHTHTTHSSQLALMMCTCSWHCRTGQKGCRGP